MSRCVMNFKDLADRYDAWYQTPLGTVAHALESEAVFELAEARPGVRTVDIGCGTGIYTLELARRGVKVIGVDSSIEIIAVAQAKLRQAGLPGRFVCASAEALPFREERFDLAVAVTSLCFVRSPDRALEEMHRVLRPSGRLVIGELNRFSLWALLRRIKGLFTDTIYNHAHFRSRRELERLLWETGFRMMAVRNLLFFPPLNRRAFLKSCRLFETVFGKFFPGTGAFLVIKAERRF